MSNQVFDIDDAMSLLEVETVQTSASLSTHAATAQKGYTEILRSWNVTSFSQLETFYRCPRKFQLGKERAAFQPAQAAHQSENVDFAFGHAVGAGIQNFLAYGKLDHALLSAMLAWRIDFFAEIPKKKKNLWGAMIAVEMFANQVLPEQLADWELLILPTGKPAIEVSFSFHCHNGFKHYGHMDIALRNKRSKKIMVVDCKTTGMNQAEEAIYSNSSQALSYAIMLEACLPEEILEYEVMYLVYQSTEREWVPLIFTKTIHEQAEWVKDLLFTHDLISTYHSVGFFPKRGSACYDFFRRCEFYGVCNLTADQKLPRLEEDREAEQPDYVIDLQEVIDKLQSRKKGKVQES
jgi:hypothetical protein